ncbi:unnamed protein product [Hermetia illucens]|uniref:Uncharacterized protein n=2 Tax=Hermetia illucens TaxID=343691 RepID=A0A7R8V035_HERIL|nr:unnamed protein product [Hermetia illucens]
MGCAASQAGLSHAAQTDIIGKGDVDEPTISASLDPVQYPPAEAFEIPIADGHEHGGDDSLIRKHPPKRLQRLTEVPLVETTIEDLEEKLAKADIRRQRYLQEKAERIESLGSTGLKNKSQDKEEDGHEGNNKDI